MLPEENVARIAGEEVTELIEILSKKTELDPVEYLEESLRVYVKCAEILAAMLTPNGSKH